VVSGGKDKRILSNESMGVHPRACCGLEPFGLEIQICSGYIQLRVALKNPLEEATAGRYGGYTTAFCMKAL